YGDLVCLAVLTASAGRRRDDAERDGRNNRHENSCSHPRLLEPSTRDLGAVMPLWLCGRRAMVEASNWYLPMATARTLAHKTTCVKTVTRTARESAAQTSRRLSSVTIR